MIRFEKRPEEYVRERESVTLSLRSIRHIATRDEAWESRRTFSSHYRLTVLLQGRLRYTANRIEGTLQEMEVLCTAPGSILSVRVCPTGACEVFLLEFDCDDSFFLPPDTFFRTDPVSSDLRNDLIRMKHLPSPQRDALLLLVLSQLGKGAANQPAYKTVIERLTRYIAKNRTRPLTAEETAAALGYSKDHLSRVLRRCGLPPLKKLLCEERLRAAAELLTETDISVKAVAEQLGFGSVNDFHKFFRYHMGTAPTAYRKKNPASVPLGILHRKKHPESLCFRGAFLFTCRRSRYNCQEKRQPPSPPLPGRQSHRPRCPYPPKPCKR